MAEAGRVAGAAVAEARGRGDGARGDDSARASGGVVEGVPVGREAPGGAAGAGPAVALGAGSGGAGGGADALGAGGPAAGCAVRPVVVLPAAGAPEAFGVTPGGGGHHTGMYPAPVAAARSEAPAGGGSVHGGLAQAAAPSAAAATPPPPRGVSTRPPNAEQAYMTASLPAGRARVGDADGSGDAAKPAFGGSDGAARPAAVGARQAEASAVAVGWAIPAAIASGAGTVVAAFGALFGGGGGGDDGLDRQLLAAAQAAVSRDIFESGNLWVRTFEEFDERNRAAARTGYARNIERDLALLCLWLCAWFDDARSPAEVRFLFVMDAVLRVTKYTAFLPANISVKPRDWKKPGGLKELVDRIGHHFTRVWSAEGAEGSVRRLCESLGNANAQLRNSLLVSVSEFCSRFAAPPWRTALESWIFGRAVFSYSALAPLLLCTARDRLSVNIREAVLNVSNMTFSCARLGTECAVSVHGPAIANGEWTLSVKEFVRRFKILIECCFPDLPSQDDLKRAVTKDIMRLLGKELKDHVRPVPYHLRVRAAICCGSQVIAIFDAASNTQELRALVEEWLYPLETFVASLVGSIIEVYSLPGFTCAWPRAYVKTLGDGRLQNDVSGRLLLLLIQECTGSKREAYSGREYSRLDVLRDLDGSLCAVARGDGRMLVSDSVIAHMMCALPLVPTAFSFGTALPDFLRVLREKRPGALAEYAAARFVFETESLSDHRRGAIAQSVSSAVRAALVLQFGDKEWSAASWVHLVSKLRLRYRGGDVNTEAARGALVSAASTSCTALGQHDMDTLNATLFSGLDIRRLVEDANRDLSGAETSAPAIGQLSALYTSACDGIALRFAQELRGHVDMLAGTVAMCDAMQSWSSVRDANNVPLPSNALQASFAACVLSAVGAAVKQSRCSLRASFAVAFAAFSWERPAGRLMHVCALDAAVREATFVVETVQAMATAFGSDSDDGFVARLGRLQDFRGRFALVAASGGDAEFTCEATGLRLRSCISGVEQRVSAAECDRYRCGKPIAFRCAAVLIVRFLADQDDTRPLIMSWMIDGKAGGTLRLTVDDRRKQQIDVPIRNLVSDAVYRFSQFSNNELEQLIAAPREVAAVLRLVDKSATENSVLARARLHQNATRGLAEELKVLTLVDNWLRNVFRQCGQFVRDDAPIEGLDQRISFATGMQLAAAKSRLSQRIMLGAQESEFTPADVDWEASLATIKHFISRGSITFRDQFTAVMLPKTASTKLRALTRQMHFQFVKQCCDQVLANSKRMVLTDDDLRIADLESENMRRLAHHGETMLKEMRIIAEFLQIQMGDVEGGFNDAMIDARLKRFKDAADLLTVARLLPAMEEALRVLSPDGDFGVLRRLAETTTEASVRAMTLSGVSAHLESVRAVTCGMQAFHVELLAGLRDKSEVVTFLKTEALDFRARLSLIQQNLQGNVVHMGVMNDLDVTHSILSQLVSGLGSVRIVNLAGLAEILMQICPTDTIKDQFLTGVTTTLAHLREIEMWFQAGVGAVSAESVLREVRLFQDSGIFVGRTPRHEAGGGLELEYRIGDSTMRQSSEVLLQTLLSAVFSRGENLGDGAVILSSFIEAHGAAEDAVAAIAAAEADGLPYMQRCSQRLGSVASAQQLRDFAADVRKSASEWKLLISAALEHAPRLRFLDRTQLLMLMRLVDASGKDKSTNVSADLPPMPASHVLAYVCMCFPDVIAGDDADEVPPMERLADVVREIVEAKLGVHDDVAVPDVAEESSDGTGGEGGALLDAESWDGGCSGSDDDGGVEERKGGDGARGAPELVVDLPGGFKMNAVRQTLQVCKQLVASAEAALREAGAVEEDAERADSSKENVDVLIAAGASPVAVYDHLLAASTKLPHACQFLWCASNTSEDSVRDFVERARCLSQLRYFAVGVDRLPSASRECLLQLLVDDEPRHENRIGWLTLVFMAHNGSEGFRFLQQPHADLLRPSSHDAARFDKQGCARAFGTRILVCGNANAGKTTRARAILSEKCGADSTRTLAVHESFSAADAAKWYVASVDSSVGGIGLHINVLAFRLALAHELDATITGPVNEEIGSRLLVMLQFLHNLIASGLIVDTATGVVAALDWSRKHHVVLELPAILGYSAETDPSHHAYLAHLPTASLNFKPELITWRSVPIIVDEKARLVAWFWRERTKLDAAAVVLPDCGSDARCVALTEGDVRTALHSMWDTKSPKLQAVHHVRREHIKLVYERCVFLARLKAEHAASSTMDLTGGIVDMLSRLFDLLVDESTQFKDGGLVNDWFRIGGFSCRPTTTVGPDQAGDVSYSLFELLYLNTSDRSRAIRDARNIRNVTVSLTDTATDPERRVFASNLRAAVARSLGVSEATLQRVVQVQAYTIMPEFAIRLLVLNEFVRIGTSVILSGETGTGKTELLMLLSSLLNCDERVFPDMAFEVRRAFEEAQVQGLLNTGVHDNMKALFVEEKQVGAAAVPAAAVSRAPLVPLPTRAPTAVGVAVAGSPTSSHQKLKDRDALLAAVEASFGKENDSSAFFRAFAPFIIPRMRCVFEQYTLMEVPEQVEAVLGRFDAYERARAGDAETGGPVWPEADVYIAEREGERMRAPRPVNTPVELARFLRDCVAARPRKTFTHIRMDPDISPIVWRKMMADVRRDAQTLNNLCKGQRDLNLRLTVFVDELNTSTILGMVKEAVIDHSVDGDPLPSNVIFFAAINPNTTDGAAARGAAPTAAGAPSLRSPSIVAGAAGANTGVVDETEKDKYIVYALPLALDTLVLNVASLSVDVETSFLSTYLADAGIGLGKDLSDTSEKESFLPTLKRCILASQKFVREARVRRVEVSIRDIMRAILFYRFFANDRKYVSVFGLTSGKDDYFGSLNCCYKGFVLALALVYYFRLPTLHVDETGRPRRLRAEYAAEMNRQLAIEAGAGARAREMPFHDVLEAAMERVFLNSAIPVGIAKTVGLKENLFANICCMEASIPLIITGPPGCGKTLSYQIAADNMKNLGLFYGQLHLVKPWVYQCSETSTAKEIESVYKTALDLYRKHQQVNIQNERCVVFLDEASLPKEKRSALKVTHYYLDRSFGSDRPHVGTVMLTNLTLDAAKTNRAVQVLQSEVSTTDRHELAKGCLQVDHLTDDTAAVWEVQLYGLCHAAERANEFCDLPGAVAGEVRKVFHQRDFVYLCRNLRKQLEATPGATLSPQLLLKALRRNYNGIAPANFKKLAKCFLEECGMREAIRNGELDRACDGTVLTSIEEALRDSDEGGDPNNSHFRHVLLLDRTENNSAVALLFDHKLLIREFTEVISMSDFALDDTDVKRSETAARVKSAIEHGKTVVLVNGARIFSALYDLFNKRYSGMGGKHYANIGLGSFSRPCMVPPEARVIVHVSLQESRQVALPFLNRFEKYSLTLGDVLTERFVHVRDMERQMFQDQEDLGLSLLDSIQHIRIGLQHFVDSFGRQSFYGLVDRATVDSLVLRVVSDTLAAHSYMPLVRRVFHVGGVAAQEDDAQIGGADAAEVASASQPRLRIMLQRQFIRRCSFQLLQIMRPEAVFSAIKGSPRLPVAYVRQYVQCQEHFSAANFLRCLARTTHDQGVARRWIVTTRTCSEISRLPFSPAMRSALVVGSPDTIIRVVSLSAIVSRAQLDDSLHRAVQRPDEGAMAHVLVLIVGDRATVTTAQMNLAMEAVASLNPTTDLVHTFVLLQHVAPEQLSYLGSSDAVFLDGWEYLFCDAFGVKFAEDAEGAAGEVSLVRDSRLWLAAAYGLDAPLSAESIANEFAATFKAEVVSSLKNIQFEARAAWPCCIGRLRPDVAIKREGVAMRVLAKYPFLLRWGLKRAAARWQGIMSSVVSDATAKIVAGETVLSLLDITSHALTSVLRGYSRFLARAVLTGYNMDALLRTLDAGPALEDEATLWESCLDLCPEPSMQALETLAELPAGAVRANDLSSKYVPVVPFVGNLFSAIVGARARVLASERHLSDNDVIAAVTALLCDDDGDAARAVGTSLDAIAKSPERWRNVVADFAAMGLGLSTLETSRVEFEVVVELLMLAVDAGSPVGLVIRGRSVQLGEVLDIMLPLRRLPTPVPPPPADAVARALLGPGAVAAGAGGASALLESLRAGVLARSLEAFAADVSSGTLSAGVAHVMRDLCVRYPTAHAVLALVPREYTSQFFRLWFARAAVLTLSGGRDVSDAAVFAAASRGGDAYGDAGDAYTSLAAHFSSTMDNLPPMGVVGDADLAYEITQFVLADGAVDAGVAKRFVADALTVQAGGVAAAVRTVTQRLVGALSTRMRLLFLRTLVCVRGPVSASVRDEINLCVPSFLAERRVLSVADIMPSARAALEAVESCFTAAAGGGGGGGGGRGARLAETGFGALELAFAAVEFWVRQLAERGEGGRQWMLERLQRAGGLTSVEFMQLVAICIAHVRGRAAAYAADAEATTATRAEADVMRAIVGFAPEMAAIMLGTPELPGHAALALCSTPAHSDAFGIPERWRVPPVARAASLELSYSRLPFTLVSRERVGMPALMAGSEAWAAAFLSASDMLARPGGANFAAWLAAAGDVYRARGALFLAIFHGVFEVLPRKPCPAWAREAVQGGGLQLSDDERKAFMTVVNLPSERPCDQDAGVEYFFSEASFLSRDPSDSVRRTQLAAVMAYMLGVPREKCYARMCCFETGAMQASYGPGSDYGGYSKDCGYTIAPKPVAGRGTEFSFGDRGHAPLPAPFAGCIRHRACNNYVIWMGLAWGYFLRHSAATRQQFLYTTAVHDHTDVGRGGDPILKTLVTRANAFLAILSTDRDGLGDVDATMYLSLAIEALMVGSHADGTGVFRDRYPSNPAVGAPQIGALYGAMTALWTPLIERARVLRGVYERAVENKSPMFAAQAASAVLLSAAKVVRPLSAADVLAELTLAVAAPAASDVDRSALALTSFLLQEGRRLTHMRHVSTFVEIYQWLHRRLAHRFSVRETISTMTVDAAIAAEPDVAERAYGTELYRRFAEAWAEIRESWQFEVCRNAADAREDEIPDIEPRTLPLFNLLSSPDPGEGDYVLRMLVQGFVVRQRKVLMADGVSVLLASAAVNPRGLLAARDDDVASVPVQRLRGERGAALTVAPVPCFDACITALGMAALSPTGAVRPARVASWLLRAFVAGRPLIDPRPDLRTPFAFRSDGVAPDEKVAAAVARGRAQLAGGAAAAAAAMGRGGGGGAGGPAVAQHRTGPMRSCGERLSAILAALDVPAVADGAMRRISTRVVESKLRQVANEADATEVIEAAVRIGNMIAQRDGAAGGGDGAGAVGRTGAGVADIVKLLSSVTGDPVQFVGYAQYTLAWYNKRGFLFSWVPGEKMDALPADFKSEIEACLASIAGDAERLEVEHDAFKALGGWLCAPEQQRMLKIRRPGDRLLDAKGSGAVGAGGAEIVRAFWSETVFARHLGEALMLISSAQGQLAAMLAEARAAAAARAGAGDAERADGGFAERKESNDGSGTQKVVVYTELVPDEYRGAQAGLVHTEAAAMAADAGDVGSAPQQWEAGVGELFDAGGRGEVGDATGGVAPLSAVGQSADAGVGASSAVAPPPPPPPSVEPTPRAPPDSAPASEGTPTRVAPPPLPPGVSVSTPWSSSTIAATPPVLPSEGGASGGGAWECPVCTCRHDAPAAVCSCCETPVMASSASAPPPVSSSGGTPQSASPEQGVPVVTGAAPPAAAPVSPPPPPAPPRVTDPADVRAAVIAYAIAVSSGPARAAPTPSSDPRLGGVRYAALLGLRTEELEALIAAGAVTTIANRMARRPFTCDITSAPAALREQLVGVDDIATAVGAGDAGAAGAALGSLGVAVLNVTAGTWPGAYVLHSALFAAGRAAPRPPVALSEAAALLGLSGEDAAYLAAEGVFGETGGDAGGGGLTVPRDAVDAARLAEALTPVDAVVAELTPLVEAANLGSEEDARAAVRDRLQEMGAREIVTRGDPRPRVLAAAGRKVVDDMVADFGLQR